MQKKTQHITILFLFFILRFATAQDRIDSISEYEMKSFSKEKMVFNSTAIRDFDLTFSRCEWRVDPSIQFISGNITQYIRLLNTAPDSIIIYHLSN